MERACQEYYTKTPAGDVRQSTRDDECRAGRQEQQPVQWRLGGTTGAAGRHKASVAAASGRQYAAAVEAARAGVMSRW